MTLTELRIALCCFLFQLTEIVLLSCNFSYHQVLKTNHQTHCALFLAGNTSKPVWRPGTDTDRS